MRAGTAILPYIWKRLERDDDFDAGAVGLAAGGGEFATRLTGAGVHADHAETGAVDDVSALMGEAFAVVFDGEPDALIPLHEADLDFEEP